MIGKRAQIVNLTPKPRCRGKCFAERRRILRHHPENSCRRSITDVNVSARALLVNTKVRGWSGEKRDCAISREISADLRGLAAPRTRDVRVREQYFCHRKRTPDAVGCAPEPRNPVALCNVGEDQPQSEADRRKCLDDSDCGCTTGNPLGSRKGCAGLPQTGEQCRTPLIRPR